jgi:hypothetical protein
VVVRLPQRRHSRRLITRFIGAFRVSSTRSSREPHARQHRPLGSAFGSVGGRGFFGVSDSSPWLSLAVVGCSFLLVAGIALRLLATGYKLRS